MDGNGWSKTSQCIPFIMCLFLSHAKVIPVRSKQKIKMQDSHPWESRFSPGLQEILMPGDFLFFFCFFVFWPRHATCGILVPPTGIEPCTPCIGSAES